MCVDVYVYCVNYLCLRAFPICFLFLFLFSSYFTYLLPSRIGPLHFQVGCHRRRLKQVFSLLCLFCVIVFYVRVASFVVFMFYGFILKMLLFTAHKFFGMYGSHNAIKCHLHTSLPFQPRYTGLRQIQPTILSTIDSLPAPD